ncbi:MAG: C4-type zinc ribbon domain-containing protein [Candidatus Omnitrophota bacterium]
MVTKNLKEQLKTLIELQAIDSEIYILKADKEAKPGEIEALQAAFDDKKKILADCEKKSLDLARQKKDREIELGSKEEGIKKLQGQLYQLKTNNEYKTMLKQIDDAKADASVIEDKILEIMEGTDKARADLEQEKKKITEEEKVFILESKKIEDKIKEIDGRLARLDAQRRQVIPGIDKKILLQYERILVNREGLAIVWVEDNSCKGCNMSVPAQVINLIKMYERVITCEVCNRMLYIKDES